MSLHLHFRESGTGEPLVVLHGVFGSGDNWLTVTKLFTPMFRVFLVDQRNHGRSPHSDEFSYDALVEDLKDFADQQSLPVFNLIGHSMGGKVAMKFAAKYPERLSKMVVVDIAPRYYNPHHQEIMSGFKSVDLKKMVARQEADEAMLPYIPEMDVRQFLLKNLYRNSEGEFAWRINLPVLENAIDMIGESLNPDLRILVPTLFIKGEKSRYISHKDEAQIAVQFLNSRIIEIQGAGHWVQAEQPQLFAEAVMEFLQHTNA
ncbi:MAG TPA: alpha/beta fold hydrolase [Catalimonadaceae bacterium]|jgi:esterase|nr:alpha/beta fold hydrolase [Catalimonadaceae bacterium]